MVAILLLIGFLLAVLYFVASRQLKNSKVHRLRLLAGLSSRVEATVPDLVQRFVKIAETTPQAGDVRTYVDQLPYLSFLPEGADTLTEADLCPAVAPAADAPPIPSIELQPLGRWVYLVFHGKRPKPVPDGADQNRCEGDLREVRARLDLDALLSPAVLPGSFDSILLADAADGRVLFQHGEPALQLTSLEVIAGALGTAGDGGEGEKPTKGLFGRAPGTLGAAGLMGNPATGSASLEVAESRYRLFVQPVELQLPPLHNEASKQPVQWVAVGFVSQDRLLSASFTSSPVLLFALLSIFPLGVLAWPFLKLWLVSGRQRLTRVDVAFLVMASLLGCFLLTLLVRDVAFYFGELEGRVDRQLETLAGRLETDLYAELDDAFDQLERLDRERGAIESKGGGGDRLEGLLCDSPDDCAGSLPEGFALDYPIFHSVFWVDSCGDQRVKLALREPSLRKINVYQRGYFRCAAGLSDPYLLRLGAGEAPRPVCLEAVISNTGGNDQAILALPRSQRESRWRCSARDLRAQNRGAPASPRSPPELQPVMATRLVSLTRVPLPPNVELAVVDASEPGRARVLFHSDPRRILSEDLLEATDEDSLLASVLASRRQGTLSSRYWGERHRFHARPLPGLPWTLVTFRRLEDLRLRNLELLYDVANPFLLLIAPAYLGLVLLLALGRRGFRHAFWPDPNRNRAYRWIVWWCSLTIGVFSLLHAVAARLAPSLAPVLFWASLGLPLLTLLVNGWRLARGDREGSRPVAPERRRRLADRLGRLRTRLGERLTARDSTGKIAGFSKWARDRLDAAARPYRVILLLGALPAALGVALSPSLTAVSLLVAILAVAAFRFHWRFQFDRQNRRRSYLLAMSCLLFVVAVLPAIGLFSLARERQWTFLVQETQEGLSRALETRRVETLESRSGEAPFFERHKATLRELRRGVLATFFDTQLGRKPQQTSPQREEPSAPDGRELRPASAKNGERSVPDGGAPGWPWSGWMADRFSARPVPVNDLSSTPSGVDLSRFESPIEAWWRSRWLSGSDGGPRLTTFLPERYGTGAARSLVSTVPLIDELSLPVHLSSIGFLALWAVWLAAPVLCIGFIADRLLLVRLARVDSGEPRAGAADPAPDLGDLRQLLAPENLRDDRMLLVLGVPELALEAISGHLRHDRFHVLPWCADREADDARRPPATGEQPAEQAEATAGASRPAPSTAESGADAPAAAAADGGAQAETSGAGGALEPDAFWRRLDEARRDPDRRSVLVSQFSIDLQADDASAARAERKLRALGELHRTRDRAVVVLADVEPRRVLSAVPVDEDPASPRAVLRRQWSGLLGAFIFRYASDRGDPVAFENDVRERRIELTRARSDEVRELVETRTSRREWIARLQAREEELRGRTGPPEGNGPDEALPATLEAVTEALGEAARELDKGERALDDTKRDPQFQETLKCLRLLVEECRPTGQLQRIGRQVLREITPGGSEAFTRDKMVAKIALLARAYYQAIWASTSEDEQVVLAQLAYTGLVSPQNQQRVLDLMYRGLIVRDPALRLMNESFALFVRQTVDATQMLEWEGDEGTSVWSILRWLLPVPLLLLGGFVFITQRDAVSSAVGFIIAAASIAPTLVNMFGYFQQRFARRVVQERERRPKSAAASG